jgi:hypothetical protein
VAEIVDHPPHYTSHPSGVECIEIAEHMDFNTGNAFKYVWRAGLKDGKIALEKALWYVRRQRKMYEADDLDMDAFIRVVAYETDVSKVMALYHILAADRHPTAEPSIRHLTQAEKLLEEMIDGIDAKAATH